MSRSVTCVNFTGFPVPDASVCVAGEEPVSIAQCDTEVSCGCSTTADCPAPVGHWICNRALHVCECSTGWIGPSCSLISIQSTRDACTGVVDTSGVCCTGLIDSTTGKCCSPTATLSSSGQCCDGVLDGCGVCNGTGVAVDVNGVCCDVPLSPGGTCCASAALDSCGVCGGVNECGSHIGVVVTNSSAFNTAFNTSGHTRRLLAGTCMCDVTLCEFVSNVEFYTASLCALSPLILAWYIVGCGRFADQQRHRVARP